jgi:hypothetical protein
VSSKVLELMDAVRAVLTPDLLKPQYRNHPENPMFGHCYVASEALYHLLGGHESSLQPYRGKDDAGIVHWWLEDQLGNRYDVTVDQYLSVGRQPPYTVGRAGGFLTKQPSKRAQIVINRVHSSAVPRR